MSKLDAATKSGNNFDLHPKKIRKTFSLMAYNIDDLLPKCFRRWLASQWARLAVLGIAACLSLPSHFAVGPSIGIDPSWMLSLEMATISGKVFGREFVFTHGPLGYLLIHAPVDKASLVLYDVFVLASLLAIYSRMLPRQMRPVDVGLLVVLAAVTKESLLNAPSVVLFAILCYWLWHLWDAGGALATLGSLTAAVVLFFGKVNYGMPMALLMPSYGVWLIIMRRDRRLPGVVLLIVFPVLLVLGASLWHVDLAGYRRSAAEIIAGYSEAMARFQPPSLLVLGVALVLISATAAMAFLGRRRLPWEHQAVILPLIGVAILLMFKNAFVRSDADHHPAFYGVFPLVVAVWCAAWRNASGLRALLLVSLLYPLSLMIADSRYFGWGELSANLLPQQYFREVADARWKEKPEHLRDSLRRSYPEEILPKDVREEIGGSSVDVMPWEASIAVLNGLSIAQRPVHQSYAAYTPHLDGLNARFLSSSGAPDFMLYCCAQESTIDGRVPAWDESITKRALLENYTIAADFRLPMHLWGNQKLESATVFLLRHTHGCRRFVPVATNGVNLAMGQALSMPETTNLVFLSLDVDRNMLGKLEGYALSPCALTATLRYEDGRSRDYRAVLPIMRTGVLINRRVESIGEVRRWLDGKPDGNTRISSISFKSSGPWLFRSPFKGVLVEYILVDEVASQERVPQATDLLTR
jgi:hypothetical protein